MQLQFLHAAALLLSHHLVAAQPSPAEYDLVQHDPKARATSTDVATPLMERAKNCVENKSFGSDVMDRIGSTTSVAAYSVFGGYSSWFVCTKNGWSDCNHYANLIGGGITVIFYAYSDISSANAPVTAGSKRATISMTEHLTTIFNTTDSGFDSITDTTADSLQGLTPRDGALVEHVSVRGLKMPLSNLTMDFNVLDFGGGNGHIEFPGDLLPKNGTALETRAAGPGFKISYTTRLRNKMSQSHISTMGSTMGFVWGDTVNHNRQIANMMGFVETGHEANFYWRIIPESGDFLQNYESVDICGGMGGFL